MAVEITGRINFDDSELISANQTVKEFKDTIDSIPNSASAAESAVKDVGKAVDNIDEGSRIETLDNGFRNLKDSADVVAGSVEAVVGGLALFGVETQWIENIERSTLGAIAVADGIDRFGSGLLSLSKNTKLAAKAQRIFNVVANANPYLLAVTAILATVGAFVALSEAFADTELEAALANQTATELSKTLRETEGSVDDLNLSAEDTIEIFKQAKEEAQEGLNTINNSTELLKQQGFSEEDILDLKIEQSKQIIIQAKAELEAQKRQKLADVERTTKYQKITETILQFLTMPIQTLLGAVDGIVTALNFAGVISDETFESIGSLRDQFNESSSGFLFDPAETAAEADETIKETEAGLLLLENSLAGFENKKSSIRDKARAEDKRKDDEAAQERQDKRDLELEAIRLFNEQASANKVDLLLQIEELENAHFDSMLSRQVLEENAVRDKYFALIEAAREAGIDTAVLVEAQEAELARIRNVYREGEKVATIKADEEEKTLAELLKQKKLDIAEESFGHAMNLLSLADSLSDKSSKRGFERSKKIAVAQTVISTLQGVQNALTAKTVIPEPFGRIVQIANAAAIGVSGAVNIKKIRSQKFESGGTNNTSGGSSGSTSGSAAPSFTGGGGIIPSPSASSLFGTGAGSVGVPGADGINNNNNSNAQPLIIKAVVSETDLTQTSNRIDLIKNGSEL